MGFFHCCIYLMLLGAAFFIAGRLVPKGWIREECFPYRCYNWEKNGRIYEKVGIKSWQNKLPDMSKILPGIMPPKKLSKDVYAQLPIMIKETCIAEFIHILLAMFGLHCVEIWEGMGGAIMSLLYMLGNIPFVLIQRYNRPRLQRVLRRKRGLSENNEDVNIELQYGRGT